MMYPKKSWTVDEDTEAAYNGAEGPLQQQLDEMLDVLRIWFIRIPDNFWSWLFGRSNASAGMKRELGHYWGGMPDTTMMLKVSDKYMLCCPVELKRKDGKRHGKQKHWEIKSIPFQISRSPERNIAIVRQFQADAAIVAGLFEAQKENENNS